MAQELLDIYDQLGQKTGKTKDRNAVHKDGDWHATIHFFIVDEKKRILLQKRSTDKPIYPGMLVAPVSGHVSAEESLVDALFKEAREEAQVNLSAADVMLLGMRQFEYHDESMPFHDREFVYAYIATKPISIDSNLSNDEVTGFVWKSPTELAAMVKRKDPILVPCWAEYLMVLEYLGS